MNAIQPKRAPAEFTIVMSLARLFEKLEHSPTPVSAAQYRWVARSLGDAIASMPGDDTSAQMLRAALDMFPAASELYENLHYQHAGLCRSPLDASLNAEVAAREAIARAAAQVPAQPASREAPGRTA